MQYKTDIPPSMDNYKAHPWEKPHKANMTGSAAAYRPKGSILSPEKRQEVTGDYEPWTP
jgi:NADH:ubiquinone oxidoreductase subunit